MAIENHQRVIGARDTKANIEALTGTLEEQAIAYATDTGEIGIYTNGAWVWIGGQASDSGEVLMADGEATATPLANDEDTDWLYSE